jgi:hypothetical protein
VVATLTPAKGTTALGDVQQVDAYRREVNAWIRNQRLAAVADFDEALEDPERPGHLSAQYSSPDHLHPNSAGYQALANTVPLEAIGASVCPTPATSEWSDGPMHERVCAAGWAATEPVEEPCGIGTRNAWR